jgi:hypothetical protein
LNLCDIFIEHYYVVYSSHDRRAIYDVLVEFSELHGQNDGAIVVFHAACICQKQLQQVKLKLNSVADSIDNHARVGHSIWKVVDVTDSSRGVAIVFITPHLSLSRKFSAAI